MSAANLRAPEGRLAQESRRVADDARTLLEAVNQGADVSTVRARADALAADAQKVGRQRPAERRKSASERFAAARTCSEAWQTAQPRKGREAGKEKGTGARE